MNAFKRKRSSLEAFLKEQIIGPGAYNKRYFFIDDWELPDFEFSDQPLSTTAALDNFSEVIPEVPAYQYSSGILFPETRIKKSYADTKDKSDDEIEDGDINNTSADDDEIVDETNESLVSKQQNYPNQMGVSFVASVDCDLQRDLNILIEFRKYRRISKRECSKKRIAIWIPEYIDEITKAIQSYFNTIFSIESRAGNYFVVLKNEITRDDIYDIDYIGLNYYVRNELISELENIFPGELRKLDTKNETDYFGITDENNLQFYSVGSKSFSYGKKEFKNVVTLYDNTICKYIESQLQESADKYSKFKILIKKIEIYNQLRNTVTDLKSIFKDWSPTPIWQSRKYSLNFILPEYNKNKVVDRKEAIAIKSGDPELENLKIRVQYIRKKNLLYVKFLLVNYFQILLEANEPPQLNKKDEANKISIFGVQIKVVENKSNILRQYNPPQLLDIDEEDNFNKLLYRNYIDYGEGYNTSVTWGKESGLNYISTNFLPEQETPKVDFIPSKIVDRKVISRLQNDDVLSFRNLSTLSNTNNESVLDGLDLIIKEYEKWIGEKAEDLSSIAKKEDKEILERQINSCRMDCLRLKRNIKLLSQDPQALVAFRLMNTAMFMQLHHSILKRSSSSIQATFGENYYREVKLKDDYKWRSFQLAFILLNIDSFVKPKKDDSTIEDVFGSGWPERNEIADLIWFPTGGGKTEAYLGIIAFVIAYRRFTKGSKGFGTTVLMRYTLRLLTLEQFQRATLLICALDVIRKDKYYIPNGYELGEERITIGLFVGSTSLPNSWNEGDKSMLSEISKISKAKAENQKVATNLPFTSCPWCGCDLFNDEELNNVFPNHNNKNYRINDELSISCTNKNCTYFSVYPTPNKSLPLRLFDEDIYKFPPTLLFGTVDKFAALANKISTNPSKRKEDSRRLFGSGYNLDRFPPELIIQDELHLLMGPLGTAVGLFEKGIDYLCTYLDKGIEVRPKIITSTATTRNTDKQIFALFNRRSEIFPKQGITCDDSFFAYYQRDGDNKYISNRKYVGVLPIGKTQVWMQLRVASISLAHRLKYLKENFTLDELFESSDEEKLTILSSVFDYYHTVLSYFNSLKDVGKTQSQLSHFLPGDVNYIIKNTIPWCFLDKITREDGQIEYSELTGRLSGEDIKTNKSYIERKWKLFSIDENVKKLNTNNPPEFVISTNMISVGIDISRFNTMIISSMPRNIAEYIQASSRVAREKEGVVFTIHHPFRSRDISHYQRFKEFHEKFYSYVEPISVTPFATKALDRYLAMLAAVLIRHNEELDLTNNEDVINDVANKRNRIRQLILDEGMASFRKAVLLNEYFKKRSKNRIGISTSVDGIISENELSNVDRTTTKLIDNWIERLREASSVNPPVDIRFRKEGNPNESLFVSIADNNHPLHWKVSHSLREIAPSTVIKTVQQ